MCVCVFIYHGCFITFKLRYAFVVSLVYGVLMIVVLIGILKEVFTAGLCSVTSLFLLFVVGIFFVSAVVHPKV